VIVRRRAAAVNQPDAAAPRRGLPTGYRPTQGGGTCWLDAAGRAARRPPGELGKTLVNALAKRGRVGGVRRRAQSVNVRRGHALGEQQTLECPHCIVEDRRRIVSGCEDDLPTPASAVPAVKKSNRAQMPAANRTIATTTTSL
jgi:hypothetical protein